MSCLEVSQPHGVEIAITDDIFVKQMVLDKAGTLVPQHTHAYDHLSMLAVGSVRIWRDGKLDGDYQAPCGIVIKAGVAHMFLSLEDNTIVYCVHNISHSGDIDILRENTIETALAHGAF